MKLFLLGFLAFVSVVEAKILSSSLLPHEIRGGYVHLNDGHAFKLCENDTTVTPTPPKYQKFSFYINSDHSVGALVADGINIDSNVLIKDSSICKPKVANEEIIIISGDVEIYNSFIQGFTIVDTSKNMSDDLRTIHINESEIIGTGEIRDKVAIYNAKIYGDIDIAGNVGDGISITNSKLDFPSSSLNKGIKGSVNIYNVYSNGNLRIESSSELPSEFYKNKRRSSLINLDRAWPTLFNINIGSIGDLENPGFVGNFYIKNFATLNIVRLTGNACLNGNVKPGIKIHDGVLDFGTNNQSKGLLGFMDLFDVNLSKPRYITNYSINEDTNVEGIDFCSDNVESSFPVQNVFHGISFNDVRSTGGIKVAGGAKFIRVKINEGSPSFNSFPYNATYQFIRLTDVEISGSSKMSGDVDLTTVKIIGDPKFSKGPYNSDKITMGNVDIEGSPKIAGYILFYNGKIEDSPTLGGFLNIQYTTFKNDGTYIGDWDSKLGGQINSNIFLTGNNNFTGFFEIYHSIFDSIINGVGNSYRKGIYIPTGNIDPFGPNVEIYGQIAIGSSSVKNGAKIIGRIRPNPANCSSCQGFYIGESTFDGENTRLEGWGSVGKAKLLNGARFILTDPQSSSEVFNVISNGYEVVGSFFSFYNSNDVYTSLNQNYYGHVACYDNGCSVITSNNDDFKHVNTKMNEIYPELFVH